MEEGLWLKPLWKEVTCYTIKTGSPSCLKECMWAVVGKEDPDVDEIKKKMKVCTG